MKRGTPFLCVLWRINKEAEQVAMSAGGHLAAKTISLGDPAGRTLAPQGCLGPFQRLLLLNSGG